MNGTAQVREPRACTDEERQAFERLVREGFDGSDAGLPSRIGGAAWLAFYYAPDDTLVAVAGLKVPTPRYRDEAFAYARAPVAYAEYEFELGWVYVVATYRGNGVAGRLCTLLMARVPASGVFATTRPDNAPMISILRNLGFTRTGESYSGRREELTLWVRAAHAD